jgi:hypothetical protein
MPSPSSPDQTNGERQGEVTTILILVASIGLTPLVCVALYLFVSGVFTNRKALPLGSSPISRKGELRVVPVVVTFQVSDTGGDHHRVCTVVNNRAEGSAPLTSQSPVPQRKDNA